MSAGCQIDNCNIEAFARCGHMLCIVPGGAAYCRSHAAQEGYNPSLSKCAPCEHKLQEGWRSAGTMLLAAKLRVRTVAEEMATRFVSNQQLAYNAKKVKELLFGRHRMVEDAVNHRFGWPVGEYVWSRTAYGNYGETSSTFSEIRQVLVTEKGFPVALDLQGGSLVGTLRDTNSELAAYTSIGSRLIEVARNLGMTSRFTHAEREKMLTSGGVCLHTRTEYIPIGNSIVRAQYGWIPENRYVCQNCMHAEEPQNPIYGVPMRAPGR